MKPIPFKNDVNLNNINYPLSEADIFLVHYPK